jgi:hypothetical protein
MLDYLAYMNRIGLVTAKAADESELFHASPAAGR